MSPSADHNEINLRNKFKNNTCLISAATSLFLVAMGAFFGAKSESEPSAPIVAKLRTAEASLSSKTIRV